MGDDSPEQVRSRGVLYALCLALKAPKASFATDVKCSLIVKCIL
jgi:hypothetical protein